MNFADWTSKTEIDKRHSCTATFSVDGVHKKIERTYHKLQLQITNNPILQKKISIATSAEEFKPTASIT